MTENELRESFDLELGDRRMRAQIMPRSSSPPRGLNATELQRYLTSCGIQFGMERETLKAIISAWKLGDTGPWIVAEGTEPEPGRHGGLNRIAPPPRTGRDEVELLPLYVKRGDRLFKKLGPLAPAPGRDVLGTLVPPPITEDAPQLVAGRGIEVLDDGTWISRATGFLHAEDGELRILKTLLHSRTLGPGTYRWPGDAQISGPIAAGTTIEVGGHLHVEGDVGVGAHLRAEGDLRIEGTVTGGGTTKLESEGRMKLHTAIGTLITAGGDIVVSVNLEDCRTRTRGVLRAEETGCQIIGGTVVFDVCADGKHHAVLSVGRASWVNDEMRNLEVEIRRWVNYHGKLFQDFRDHHGEHVENRALIWQVSDRQREEFYRDEDQVHAEQQRVDQRISRLRSRLEALAASRTFNPKAVVHIRGTAEGGTRFSVRGRRYEYGKKPLSKVAIGICGEARRVCAVPSAIFLSSEMQ